jgi:hypothetical protein
LDQKDTRKTLRKHLSFPIKYTTSNYHSFLIRENQGRELIEDALATLDVKRERKREIVRMFLNTK